MNIWNLRIILVGSGFFLSDGFIQLIFWEDESLQLPDIVISVSTNKTKKVLE